MPRQIARAAYAHMNGPTLGDRARLAATEPFFWQRPGDPRRHGRSQRTREQDVADTVIANALILDHCAALLSEEDAEDQQGGHRRCGEATPGTGEGAGTMSDERFSSMWDAIEGTPAAAGLQVEMRIAEAA